MDMLARFKNSAAYNYVLFAYNAIAVLCVLYTAYSIIKTTLISLNWIPGYICEWHETKSITPFINMFSGQEVRLDFDVYGDIPKKSFKLASWQLSNGPNIQTSNELTPTFPLTEGGIFEVSLTAKLDDGSLIQGKTNLNVIETKPKVVTANTPTTIPLTHTTTEQVKKIQSTGVEVYSGNGKWQTVQSSVVNGTATLQFQPNQAIPTFSGQVLYRTQDTKNNLSGYGAANFPFKNE